MAPPIFPIDRTTGLVAVIHIPTGKIKRMHPVDVKEQLACVDPQIRLANVDEAPPPLDKKTVDYSQMPLEKLRECAQEAGISFAGKSRAMIEDLLNEAGFVPKVEE